MLKQSVPEPIRRHQSSSAELTRFLRDARKGPDHELVRSEVTAVLDREIRRIGRRRETSYCCARMEKRLGRLSPLTLTA